MAAATPIASVIEPAVVDPSPTNAAPEPAEVDDRPTLPWQPPFEVVLGPTPVPIERGTTPTAPPQAKLFETRLDTGLIEAAAIEGPLLDPIVPRAVWLSVIGALLGAIAWVLFHGA